MSEDIKPIDENVELRERLKQRIILDALYNKMIDLQAYLSALEHREASGEANRERSQVLREIGDQYGLSDKNDALIELWKASQEVFKLEGNIPDGISLEEAENLVRKRKSIED
jgi:hypothetical protein